MPNRSNAIGKIGIFYIGLLLLPGLTGCAPAIVAGGATAVAAVGERRGPQEFVEDNWVAVKIRSLYLQSDSVSPGNINVSVYRGRVLLTGTASSEIEIAEAIRIAKEVRGAWSVHSELKVQYATVAEITEDSVISNKVKLALLAEQEVRGLDIHVETTKGVVYLLGSARSVEERDRAIRAARQVSNVREVVSYIDIDKQAYPVSK
ncbi:MAG: BON domain-containing protein [Magnetococcales bacterium]|nr:BON domain-containing protein [Magnetococcales bacterium]